MRAVFALVLGWHTLSGCTTTPSTESTVSSPYLAEARATWGDTFSTGNPDYDKCANQALIEHAARHCGPDGQILGCFGAAGRGAFIEAVDSCGYLTAPTQVLPEDEARLKQFCPEDEWKNLPGVSGKYEMLFVYEPTYGQMLAKRCDAIHRQAGNVLPSTSSEAANVASSAPNMPSLTNTTSNGLPCSPDSRLAENIMRARQNGLRMADAMRIADNVGSDSPPEVRQALKGMVQALVEMAYQEPRYSTPSIQQETITEFGNRVYRLCLEARRQ